MSRRVAPDQAERDAATYERARNVLIDAGAGTGKTSTLVGRLVEYVAPTRGAPAVPIGRIAAITFTRKAAGELRLRIRERLLDALAREPLGTPREEQLRDALAGLDTASVGTIHGFCDRLLRLRPVEAGLSPSYEIAEDDEPLIRETFELLIESVEAGKLGAELAGTDAARHAAHATRTVLDALAAGLKAESTENEWAVHHGLDALVAAFVRLRDVEVADAGLEAVAFDASRFRAAADEFLRLAGDVRGESVGADWIRDTRRELERLRAVEDPVRLRLALARQLRRAPRKARKGQEFAGDGVAWRLWKRFTGEDHAGRALEDELLAAADRWLATRLAGLSTVVVALYGKVKARRRALDSLDLLQKLRDLLTQDMGVRGEFQRMFDHVFVDEFQDTDPLQAEVVLYVCEREPKATRWEDVVLADGKLTLVGDPKQSIYRFRRADVAMYDRVRRLVARGPHLSVTLSANFRSVPGLIEWVNDRFREILGEPKGDPFDPATGRVFYQPLQSGRAAADTSVPAVHVVEFELEKGNADAYRALEGRALADTFRGWVDSGERKIVDPLDGRVRPIRFGDIAVLAVSTWRLSLLFEQMDRAGIPYASRGGRLFLEDPLHRQFLLGLRALADGDDGVAEAALLRPPFFVVDPQDLAAERGAVQEGSAESRLSAARALVAELRRRRFDRLPGATARDLLERSLLARSVAAGPNGAQRLSRLRELCHLLGATAAAQGIDYDAATARFREWIDRPAQVDPPHPVGSEAVQVLTVHQAKGLEFPVVAIWDGRAMWNTRPDSSAWRIERDGRGWMMNLDGIAWEEPDGLGIREMDKQYLGHERRRILYVAATRARDLLVVPKAGRVDAGRFVCGDLLRPGVERLVSIARYEAPSGPREAPDVRQGDELSVGEDAAAWRMAADEAARPRFSPGGVSTQAHDERTPEQRAYDGLPRAGRFGNVFGTVVHQAIGLVLGRDVGADEAVDRAARRLGLDTHHDEARSDVVRALDALRAAGLLGRAALRLEYPVAGAWEGGRLLGGYIDLVAAGEGSLDIVDFKTDAPPDGPVERACPEYVAQVRAYGRLLAGAGLAAGRRVRCGLLFTADGSLHWV